MDFFSLSEQMWTKDKCSFCADVETYSYNFFLVFDNTWYGFFRSTPRPHETSKMILKSFDQLYEFFEMRWILRIVAERTSSLINANSWFLWGKWLQSIQYACTSKVTEM